MLSYVIQKINPVARGREIGIWPKRGGLITLDVPVGEPIKFIRVRTAGDVVMSDAFGNTITIPDVQPGRFDLATWGDRILSAGTTATGIYWYGGD